MLKRLSCSFQSQIHWLLVCSTAIAFLSQDARPGYAQNLASSDLPALQPWLFQSETKEASPPPLTEPRQIIRNQPPIPVIVPAAPNRNVHVLPRPGESMLAPQRRQELTRPAPGNPVLTPPYRDPETASNGRLYLTRSEIVTEDINGEPRHFLVGKLSNLTNGWVDEATVHFKIYDRLWIVQSGHFSVPTECMTFGLQCLEFRFPLRETGKLEISFVHWKYADGTEGISEGGIF